jgi:hypothetical protein
MIAVPLACTNRANNSTGNPGASAAVSVQRAGRHPADQEAGDRDDHRHREQEPGGQPLAGVGVDPQVAHQHRQRDAHDGFVEQHDKRGNQQDADHRLVA